MNQTVVTVSEPAYVKNFQCIGFECEDHCCHTWDVILDKKSYKAYKKSKHPVIQNLVAKNLKLLRENDKNYAQIKIQPHCDCPFLGDDRLCEIQRYLGHEALSTTCQTYPRSVLIFDSTVERSLNLSCPEAARKILLDPSAFMIEQEQLPYNDVKDEVQHNFNFDQRAKSWLPIARQFCFDAALKQELPIEQRLMIMGLFIKQSQPLLELPQELIKLAESFRTMIGSGEFNQTFKELAANPAIQWNFFTAVSNYIVGEKLQKTLIARTMSHSDARFLDIHERFIKGVGGSKSDDGTGNFVSNAEQMSQQVANAYQNNYLPYFTDNAHILTNYLIYYIYHYLFPLHDTISPVNYFKLLVIDFFMLRTYLCGLSAEDEGLSEELVIKLFQSYARKRQHSKGFYQDVEQVLKSLGLESDAAVFALLKMAPV